MVDLNIGAAISSDLTNVVKSVTVPSQEMDSPRDQDETEWTNTKASQYWGYFNQVSDLKSALIMKSIWVVGKGYLAESSDQIILNHMTGWGFDTWEDIIFSLDVSRRIYGDSYAEIIRADNGTILNLKPLNPASMKHIVNRKGQLIRFEQTTNVKNANPIKFKPKDIFYLANNRLGDSIHGSSDIEALEQTILADNENFVDMKRLMRFQARPLIMFKLGTDDPAKIAAFVAKMDAAVNKGENIYIPDDENAVSYEVVNINLPAAIFEWRNDIRNKFYRAIGLPQIVPGAGGNSTESESKVIYLAFEQLVEREQRFLENQIWKQLKLKVDFNSPASIQPALQGDTMKDGATGGLGFQQGDVTAGVAR